MRTDQINYSQLDPKCIPLVKFFNAIGLKTIMCCEGHSNRSVHKFWIEFSKEITDEDIYNFMEKVNPTYYSCKKSEEQLIGQFHKIAYGKDSSGIFRTNWKYIVDFDGHYEMNQKLALRDLDIFKKAFPFIQLEKEETSNKDYES